jgi:xanthine dehydrogenase small subunit
MPLANAAGKHIVTVEGINPADGSLTPVQQAMVDESGTQCGFCTVGFVMSLTGFCIDGTGSPDIRNNPTDRAISAVDGNICRCTGYKSIERAAATLSRLTSDEERGLSAAVKLGIIPRFFETITARLHHLVGDAGAIEPAGPAFQQVPAFVSGGTDVYVQRPDELPYTVTNHLFYNDELRTVRETGEYIEIGASVTVTDLLESELMHSIFPRLYQQLKLVSSTPIRNMATLAGNFVNASPIGDMTIWFLALNAEVTFNTGRQMLLRQLYLGYKKLAKEPDEYITSIRFTKPQSDFRFNFEKVSKRTYLDIATVNTAASFKVEPIPGKAWVPPALNENYPNPIDPSPLDHYVTDAHIAAGGVAPIPLYLKETSSFLIGRHIDDETFKKASDIMQAEISPISDVRGSEEYKRLLLRQLFRAHFVELFTSQ